MEATRSSSSATAPAPITTTPAASGGGTSAATASGPASNARPTNTTDAIATRREPPKTNAPRTEIPDYAEQARRRSFFVKLAGFTPVVLGIAAPIVFGLSGVAAVASIAVGIAVGMVGSALTHLGMGGGISAIG